jgi:hypothetical protein
MAGLFSVEEFMMLLARFETIRQTARYVRNPVVSATNRPEEVEGE